jgi:DNA-binding beta-propeller fold protein YncE
MRIAVTSGTDGTTLIYDASLVAADTHHLGTIIGNGAPSGAWLAYDGVTFFTAFRTGSGGTIARARLKTDGVLLDRVDFYRGQPIRVYPVFDGVSVYVLTNEPNAASTHSTLHFLGFDLTNQSDPVPLCDTSALGIAAARAAGDIFVLCGGDTIVELDRKLHTRMRIASVVAGDSMGHPCGATDVALSSTGTVVFVLCGSTGTVLYLDHLTLESIASLAVGTGGQQIARAPDGQHVIVLRPAAREIVVLDVRRRVITGRVTTRHTPRAVATDSDSRSAFVATGDGTDPGTLLKVDFATGTVVGETTTVAMPITVSTWPGEESPVMRWQPSRN